MPERRTPEPARPRPTAKDFRAFDQMQSSVLDKALESAKVWRNGYALIAAGSGAVLTLIGCRLGDDTPWSWRLVLTVVFGASILFTAAALWLALTVEGGSRTTTVSLAQLIDEHNSIEAYRADQAAFALDRLDRSKRLAVVGAGLLFVGLIVTLWVPADTPAGVPDKRPAPPTKVTKTQ